MLGVDSVYFIAAVILILIVLMARLASKWQLPLIVIALGIGVIFGRDVAGFVEFNDAALAKRIADLALIFVLFVGGFGTKKQLLRPVLWQSMTLATFGVLLTATLVTLSLWLIMGYSFTYALLVGCIISSTDASAVFSILRSRSFNLRLSAISEIESATNDPMAIILTTSAVLLIGEQLYNPLSMGLYLIWQLAAGVGIGLLVGKVGTLIFDKIKVIDKGYFYVFLVGVILLSYGAADLLQVSGLLSAFFAGYVMGNSSIPYKKTLSTFLEALSTIANVGIFVMLGLLVSPSQFGEIWLDGLVLFLTLTFIARPLSVMLCTMFSRFDMREKTFISWSGLRGTVPIVLATYPVAAGIEGSQHIFNIVFFAVGLSLLVQGSTIGKVADWLKVATKARPKPTQVMELVTLHTSDLEICEIHIDDSLYEGMALICSLDLPKGTTITMINRNDEIIAPQGSTEILPGDVLYVLAKNTNIDLVTSRIIGQFRSKENGVARSQKSTIPPGKKGGKNRANLRPRKCPPRSCEIPR